MKHSSVAYRESRKMDLSQPSYTVSTNAPILDALLLVFKLSELQRLFPKNMKQVQQSKTKMKTETEMGKL